VSVVRQGSDVSGAEPARRSAVWLFRAVNERIRELEGDRTIGDYDFVCECGDDTCTSVMRMTADEYETVRAMPDQYAVLPGHESGESETVVTRAAAYTVIKRSVLDRVGVAAP
jgi:hypothetical protein